MNNKTPSHVTGVKVQCVNYIKCPLCYGCRNYREIDPDCLRCTTNRKRDICNTNKHKTELIAKMILRPKIRFDEPITFKNGGNNNE